MQYSFCRKIECIAFGTHPAHFVHIKAVVCVVSVMSSPYCRFSRRRSTIYLLPLLLVLSCLVFMRFWMELWRSLEEAGWLSKANMPPILTPCGLIEADYINCFLHSGWKLLLAFPAVEKIRIWSVSSSSWRLKAFEWGTLLPLVSAYHSKNVRKTVGTHWDLFFSL